MAASGSAKLCYYQSHYSDGIAGARATSAAFSDRVQHFVVTILGKFRMLSIVSCFTHSRRDFDRWNLLRRNDLVVDLYQSLVVGIYKECLATRACWALSTYISDAPVQIRLEICNDIFTIQRPQLQTAVSNFPLNMLD
jgi:hypothetical protein